MLLTPNMLDNNPTKPNTTYGQLTVGMVIVTESYNRDGQVSDRKFIEIIRTDHCSADYSNIHINSAVDKKGHVLGGDCYYQHAPCIGVTP